MNLTYLPLIISSLSNFVVAKNTITYCDFNPTNPIIYNTIITDFQGNEFNLVEMNNSYAIYQINENEQLFIEGSYETNSPYFKYINEDLFYLGPGNYIVKTENGEYKNLLNGNTITQNLESLSYQIRPSETYAKNFEKFSTKQSSQSSAGNNENKYGNTTIDTNGYTLIENAEYFTRLWEFPHNDDNACGIVSLSIILSYLDTFYHDDFVDDQYYYGNYLLEKGTIDYSASYTNDFYKAKEMPGPTQAFYNYLIDEHNFEVPVIEWFEPDSNAMADQELKNSFNHYLNKHAPHLQKSMVLDSQLMFNVIGKIYDKIDNGWPVIAVMLNYSLEQSQFTPNPLKPHDPIVIGYKDDKLLCHSGWHITNYTPCLVFSTYTLYAMVSFEYYGSHKHSDNVIMESNFIKRSVCGCDFTLDIC